MSLWEIVLRLGAAVVIGGVLGLNRDLHGKPTGVRTLGLVALGSALIVIGASDLAAPGAADPNAVSRIVQGVLTGIGFLGAGVILHGAGDAHRVHGLTTAACTWLTACVGLICGTGNWRLLAVALPLVFLLLVVGGPVERWFHRRWTDDDAAPPGTMDRP
jgi:putative Mg2+ transporter-C (MgtC) family protein